MFGRLELASGDKFLALESLVLLGARNHLGKVDGRASCLLPSCLEYFQIIGGHSGHVSIVLFLFRGSILNSYILFSCNAKIG